MNIRNSVAVALWSVIVFSTNVIAKDIAVYRWVDENNVVHFSQHQPRKDNYSDLTTVSSYRAREKSLPKNTSVDDKMTKYERDKVDVLAKNKQIAEKNCQAAQLNEKTLNAFDSVMFTDSEGKSRALSDKEKMAQLALSKEHIKLYCLDEKKD
jgi:hypothetical protein